MAIRKVLDTIARRPGRRGPGAGASSRGRGALARAALVSILAVAGLAAPGLAETFDGRGGDIGDSGEFARSRITVPDGFKFDVITVLVKVTYHEDHVDESNR